MPIDAGRQVAQLRHVLRLVQELAGEVPSRDQGGAELDEAVRIGTLYLEALPIVQRRFDMLASEIARWSAAGVEALLAAGDGRSPAAAARLARELEAELSRLVAILPPEAPQAAAGAIPSP
jgi:hypothetical protein